jgi:hypothetical protein
MNSQQIRAAGQWLWNDICDWVYGLRDPFRAYWRRLSKGGEKYRISFMYENGMTAARTDKTFTAYNDRAALRKAKEIAGKESWALKLELYREVEIS